MNISNNSNGSHPNHEIVILLHGIGRTKRSMNHLEKFIRNAGYDTYNIGYPSRKKSISNLSQDLIRAINPIISTPDVTVHFVTHSMGGLVTQEILSQHQIKQLGKIVLIGTPIHGSEIADILQKNLLYRWYYGPAGLELTTRALKNKPREHFPTEVGVIAGNLSLSPIAHFFMPKLHDGRVSVASTQFTQMKDHIVLPVAHTFMMSNPKVMAQVVYFLKWGKFKRNEDV